MTLTIQTLKRAQSLIRTGWTKGALARDATGKAVAPSDPTAIAWDLCGAVNAAAGLYAEAARHACFARIREALGVRPMGEFNDAAVNAQEVYNFLGVIIAKAESEQ